MAKLQLGLEEQETIINWNKTPEKASVFSYEKRVWKLCEKVGGQLVRSSNCRDTGTELSREYLIDKSCIGIRPQRKVTLTEAQREERRQRIAKLRARKQS